MVLLLLPCKNVPETIKKKKRYVAKTSVLSKKWSVVILFVFISGNLPVAVYMPSMTHIIIQSDSFMCLSKN